MAIFISLAIGFLIGYKKFVSEKLITLNSKFQLICLLILIFSMGMSIGSNKEIIAYLPTLGFKAFIFSVCCIGGSVFVVYLFSFLLDKEGKK